MAQRVEPGRQGSGTSDRAVVPAVLKAFIGVQRPRFLPGAGAATADRARSGAVTVWAVIGVVWLVFIGQVLLRWITGDDGSFGPAAIVGPDEMDTWRLVAMRVVEAISVGIMVAMAWICLIRPWRETGRIGLDGKLYIAATLAAPIDPLINYFHWTFAWNANAVNWGSWGTSSRCPMPRITPRASCGSCRSTSTSGWGSRSSNAR